MFSWIGQALAHARTALFAKYLSPEQTAEVRRRQLANMAHMDARPRLVVLVRAQMAAGTQAEAAPVQALAARWQRLFRNSYCGEDRAFRANIREAFLREPDLMVGVGVDEALMNYLYEAVAPSRVPRPASRPAAEQHAERADS